MTDLCIPDPYSPEAGHLIDLIQDWSERFYPCSKNCSCRWDQRDRAVTLLRRLRTSLVGGIPRRWRVYKDPTGWHGMSGWIASDGQENLAFYTHEAALEYALRRAHNRGQDQDD